MTKEIQINEVGLIITPQGLRELKVENYEIIFTAPVGIAVIVKNAAKRGEEKKETKNSPPSRRRGVEKT